jgi:hypothetical protein
MNVDDFEQRVQRQPLRQLPSEWRQEILSAAQQASSPNHASRITHHVPASPSLLSTLNHQLSTLLWPHPVAWAGLAAVWVAILGLSLTTSDASTAVARHASPVSPQVFMAFQEQERLLTELLGPRETPVAEQQKPRLPRPRSEGRKEMRMAQNGQAAIELREAFGVRPASWRCSAAGAGRKREQAPCTPNASHSSPPTVTMAA